MKILFAVSTLTLLAGCAATGEPQQLAQAECKVYPVTTMSITGNRKPAVSDLEQRHAQMQLATSDYRFRKLREDGLAMNNVEDALRDCNAR